MKKHYDFTDGTRSKHARRYAKGTNLVNYDIKCRRGAARKPTKNP